MIGARLTALFLVLLVGGACGGDGNNSPVAPAPINTGQPSGAGCRTSATNVVVTHETCIGDPSAPRCGTSLETLICEFQRDAHQVVCRRQRQDTGALIETTTDEYQTVSDFVTATKVIPPLPLAVRSTSVRSSQSMTERTVVDGRLVVQTDTIGRIGQPPDVTSTTTYTAWDPAGRPLSGFIRGSTFVITIAYDDVSRTRTRRDDSGGGTVTTLSERFDANGDLVWQASEAPFERHTLTSQVLATQRVCP